MCFPSNAIEQLAFTISKQIHQNTIYKIVKFEYCGDKSVKTENQIEDLLNLNRDKELPVITKIILEGDNGILYSIEPSDIGLKFATGELSYNEYKALQKDGKNKLFMYGSLSIISFVLVGWGMLFYLI